MRSKNCIVYKYNTNGVHKHRPARLRLIKNTQIFILTVAGKEIETLGFVEISEGFAMSNTGSLGTTYLL